MTIPVQAQQPLPAEAITRSTHDSVGARIPLATYRVQFSRAFTFRDARQLVGYWRDLGISDLYASPYLRASEESTHGYDVADHNTLNPAIGSQTDYDALTDELQRNGMGQLLDIVPNHMGIAESANAWWMDVLENGPSSPYATFFDITWDALQPQLRNKVLLPILGDQYGVVLENGELALEYGDGGFFLHYYAHLLPIAPGTYDHLLQPCLGALARDLEPSDERLLELQSILTAIQHLPRPTETGLERVTERQREKEVIKRRLAALVSRSPEMREALEASLRVFNGVKGEPRSFDLLDSLLNEQAYRLAFWRVASEEINYRRFFDINQLAAIRVELPEVFHETHRLILQLLHQGQVTGLRIDHPDGLWHPTAYLHQLQHSFAGGREVGVGSQESGARASPDPRLPTPDSQPLLYVVVEKILSRGEELPRDWPVHGTTGYDFANQVGGIFVDASHRRAFDDLYASFIGRRLAFPDLVNSTKKMIMLVSLASEINALAHQLNTISERHRRFRDFTPNTLTFAIREVIAALPVYRTYSTCDAAVSSRDRDCIEAAIAEAKRRNPRTEVSIFNFIRDLLLLRYPAGSDVEDRALQCDFVMKFQQTTGPVMAKGVEDTAFYIYNRLVSLNEVGGEPNMFGLSVAEFHHQNAARREHWPHSLLATSTHDTKRSEDVRARINVLSEIPREWRTALGRWSRWNARHKWRVDGLAAPSRNDEYLLYQTLLGAWPFEAAGGPPPNGRAGSAATSTEFVARIQAYMLKAVREAKVHTSWINPNEEYEQALQDFICRILDEGQSVNFLASFSPLQLKVAHFGVFNSLGQTLLKLTSPGVPDIYQGNELWDFSLVDPDNRRPVDYGLRARLFEELRGKIASRQDDLGSLLAEMLVNLEDGRIKLYVTHRALDLRQRRPGLFSLGSYEPLQAGGQRAPHVCAFARIQGQEQALVVVPRLMSQLVAGLDLPIGESTWGKSWLELPGNLAGRYRDIFSGAIVTSSTSGDGGRLALADIFEHFPLGLLERLDD